jgi:TRAP transporter TAXI family solute receptor
MKRHLFLALSMALSVALSMALSSLFLAGAADTALAARFISIGTGGVTGVYYPTGGAICRQVNQERKRHGIRCTVESTGGSVYNAKNVLAGELDFGVAQSDVQWKAVNGVKPFDEKESKLRSVFSVHPETAILVVRQDSGIRMAKDIKGKRINLGNPGSGQESTSQEVLNALGLSKDDLTLAGTLRSSEQGDALRDNKIDGFFYTVGHPNGGIKDIFFSSEASIIPLTGSGFDRMISAAPYYVNAETPGGIYRGVPNPVPTFAVKATFITSADQPDEVVYEVVKAVFDDLDSFKKLHPAYAHLTPRQMLEGLSAPLHPGALQYFKEKGLK